MNNFNSKHMFFLLLNLFSCLHMTSYMLFYCRLNSSCACIFYFVKVHVQRHESEQSCMCVLEVSILPLIGPVPLVILYDILFSIYNKSTLINNNLCF
jgi:hypothetical protein